MENSISTTDAISQLTSWNAIAGTYTPEHRQEIMQLIFGESERSNGFHFTREMYEMITEQEGYADAQYLHTYLNLKNESQIEFVFINSNADGPGGTLPPELPVATYTEVDLLKALKPGEMTPGEAWLRYEAWIGSREGWILSGRNVMFSAFQNLHTDLKKFFDDPEVEEILGFIALSPQTHAPEIIFCLPNGNQGINPADVSYTVPPWGAHSSGLAEQDFQLYVQS